MPAKKIEVTQAVVDLVKDLVSKDTAANVIKQYISQKTGCKKTKALYMYNEALNIIAQKEPLPLSKTEEKEWESSLIETKGYFFNEKTRQYIVFLKRAARNIVVNEETHRGILEAYSDWDGDARSINQICRTFQFPRAYLEEYLKIFGITHDTLPITTEDIEQKSEEQIVESLREKKQWSVLQKYNKQDWQETQKNSERWNAFKTKQLDPFETIIKTWEPPKMLPLPNPLFKGVGNCQFVCGAFDWQVGNSAKKRYLFNGSDWSTELAEKAIQNFASKIAADIKVREMSFEKCVIVLGGDLHHGFRGVTEKGTPLEVDTLRDDQFDAIFSSLVNLIVTLYQVFGRIEVRAVRGNHDGFDFYPVMKAVEAYFRAAPKIQFYIYSSRTAAFKIGSVFMLLDHGASDIYKAKVPKGGKPREAYIQSLLLSKPEELVGVKQKLFVCGDQHTFQQIEYNDFEFFMFGCLPLGDQYANHLNLLSRPRQNCLVINEDGVKEVWHYYIDSLLK